MASSGDGSRWREARNHQERGPNRWGSRFRRSRRLKTACGWRCVAGRSIIAPHPILGDAIADEIVRKLDYDYGQLLTAPPGPGRERLSCTTAS